MSTVKNDRTVWMGGGLALLASLLAIAGCTKSAGTAASAPRSPNNAALIAAGQSVYAANGCARCHMLNGQGGRMGPDLTRAGSDPRHTTQWLMDHIRNPKAHNPSSRMPAFQGRISDQNLLALATYLASLK